MLHLPNKNNKMSSSSESHSSSFFSDLSDSEKSGAANSRYNNILNQLLPTAMKNGINQPGMDGNSQINNATRNKFSNFQNPSGIEVLKLKKNNK